MNEQETRTNHEAGVSSLVGYRSEEEEKEGRGGGTGEARKGAHADTVSRPQSAFL